MISIREQYEDAFNYTKYGTCLGCVFLVYVEGVYKCKKMKEQGIEYNEVMPEYVCDNWLRNPE